MAQRVPQMGACRVRFLVHNFFLRWWRFHFARNQSEVAVQSPGQVPEEIR